jgi:diguanylate cyclase (GGDEF)-like protein
MRLSRQLILLIVGLVGLLFVGTFLVSIQNTRDYLENQLASHAQDAATSLGLSATSHFAADDQAMVTTMVNAMFHRGDYLSIRLEDLEGEAWVERRTSDLADSVPAWFINLFELRTPMREATMMSGWRQVGRVKVVSHPGLAYEKLWMTTRQTLLLFLLTALAVLLLALLGLRFVLRPIKAVEAQADAICNRRFVTSDRRPFTLEFRRVVEAMDRLSAKVGRMLSESETVATELRRQAYQDPVTGLANRRQFMDVLEHRIDDPDLIGTGAVLLVQLREFKTFNLEQGYAEGDRLLAETARRIAEALSSRSGATLAHLAGADFAILLEGVDATELDGCAARVSDAVASLYNRYPLPSSDVGHVGAVMHTGQTASEILADADTALREAQRAGANAWRVRSAGAAVSAPRSSSAWRELLERAIQRGHYSLLRQDVVGRDNDTVLHQEVFLRIRDPENINQDIPAALFMPMAESVGLATRIDRLVIERVLDSFHGAPDATPVAINLSPASLDDDAFTDWLVELLHQRESLAPRIILELPEYGASGKLESLKALISRLSPLGVGFSLDHFGKGFTSFAYLRHLNVDYLKVDGSFIRQLGQHEDNRFFIKTIADIAHGLDMKVIAESVESAAVWKILKGLGVDGGRGFLFGRPE